MGALDSACNRTCCGHVWLEHYLHALKAAPKVIQDLVSQQVEQETFKFGNGGTQKSTVRFRLPMMVGEDLILDMGVGRTGWQFGPFVGSGLVG